MMPISAIYSSLVGILPKREGGGKDGRAFAHLGLIAHAQGAPRHFHACARAAKGAVMAFFGQLGCVHFGWRRDP